MPECAFCPNPAVTKGGEHLWSDWINKILPNDPYKITQFTDQGVLRQWKRRHLDIKAPVVCAPCNHGWMSLLEEKHAKPAMKDLILSDRIASLYPDRLKSIANFAFKSAVISDHMSLPVRSPFFSTTARHAFAASLEIPHGVRIWVAALKKTGFGLFRPVYHANPTTGMRVELYAFTFAVGFLIFQVLAHRWLDGATSGIVPTQNPRWNRFSIPAWPCNGNTLFWPPKKQLDIDWANEFSLRWQHVSTPRGFYKV
jgi:hypothetical protein